jgi:hypothetical protein
VHPSSSREKLTFKESTSSALSQGTASWDGLPRVSVSYQYASKYAGPQAEGEERERWEREERERLRRVLESDLRALGREQVEIHLHEMWEYFPRFSQEDIQRRFPWRLLDLQATSRTWYAGSSACFESAEDVVCYNHLLFSVFNLSLPGCD